MRKIILILVTIASSWKVAAQGSQIVTEQVLESILRLTAPLPPSIMEAHKQSVLKKHQFDSVEKLIAQAYPRLADKMNRRSAILNSFAGVSSEGETRYIIPANQKMSDYFMLQFDKMNSLEEAFNKQVKTFYGKELYKKQGYIPVWDSVYRSRLPPLTRYRDGIIKLVQSEIAFLKANQQMFKSKDESERMQYVEAELKVLQKLVYLRDKFRQVVLLDGVEKVAFCLQHPESCQKE